MLPCKNVLQVRLESDELRLFLNSTDISDTIPDVNDTNMNSSSVVFERSMNSSIISSFENGITVTVSVSQGILSFVATVPEEFRGNTTGLLGNFNGDATDDLAYPNGTVLGADPSDSMIHNFGQSCEL